MIVEECRLELGCLPPLDGAKCPCLHMDNIDHLRLSYDLKNVGYHLHFSFVYLFMFLVQGEVGPLINHLRLSVELTGIHFKILYHHSEENQSQYYEFKLAQLVKSLMIDLKIKKTVVQNGHKHQLHLLITSCLSFNCKFGFLARDILKDDRQNSL